MIFRPCSFRVEANGRVECTILLRSNSNVALKVHELKHATPETIKRCLP